MSDFARAFPPGFARALLSGYERWTTIPGEVPAAALLVSLTLPLIREQAVIERLPGITLDAQLWVTAAGRSGVGKTTGVRDIRRRVGNSDVAVLDEASGPMGLLDALAELDGAAVLRVTEEAGLQWQALREGDRNAVELQRYDLRLFDRDAITRRSGDKRTDIKPGPLSSLEFAVSDQLPSVLSKRDIESGFGSRRCWLLASDDPTDPARVRKLHHWDFPAISARLESFPLPNVPIEPLYFLSAAAHRAWDRSWQGLVDRHCLAVGEGYLRRVDAASLVCAVICRRLAAKAGPELDTADIRYGAAWAEIFCSGAAELIQRVAGGRFNARLMAYEEWIAEFIFSRGREPTVREFQRHDQRTLTAEIARRELPQLIARVKSRR